MFLSYSTRHYMRMSTSCSFKYRRRSIAKVRKVQLLLVPSPSTEFGIISLIATHCSLLVLIDSIRNSCLTFFVLQTCKCIVYVCKIHNETLKRFMCSYFFVAVFPEAVINFKLVHSTSPRMSQQLHNNPRLSRTKYFSRSKFIFRLNNLPLFSHSLLRMI